MNIQAEIAAAVRTFRIDEAALKAHLEGPQGPVMGDLAKRAIRVQNSAKLHATDRPGPRVRTGRLRGSITWRLGHDARGPFADVGTNVHYAPFVENGHDIVRGGRVVGHARAYPFMRPALEAARNV